MSGRLDVLLATDRRGVVGAAVAGRSLLDSAAGTGQIHLHLAGGDLTAEDRRILTESWSVAPGAASITFRDFPLAAVADLLRSKTVSRMSYARLFAAEMLPAEAKRAIYLDMDMVVRRDVLELTAFDLAGAVVGATANGPSGDGRRELARLGVPGDNYFNAGFLLIDLEAWRAREVGTRALQFCRTFAGTLNMHDQDALNGVLSEDWAELPPHWNSWVAKTTDPDSCVLHYTMTPKPWDVDYSGRYADIFFAALDRTALRGWRPNRLLGLAPYLKRLQRRIPYWPTVVRLLRERLRGGAPRAAGAAP